MALQYANAGISVVPIRNDGSKAATCSWKAFQERIPNPDKIRRVFRNGCGIAAITGRVSGFLEVIDFEADAPFHEWLTLVEEQAASLVPTLVIIQTPSGGHHVVYRCPDGIEGNQKLAMLTPSKVLIETRGEGGYVVTVGSPANCHPSGKQYSLIQGDLIPGSGEHTIPVITADQRGLLLDAARTFDRGTKEKAISSLQSSSLSSPAQQSRPGDLLNEHSTWNEILEPYDWKAVGRRGDETLWRRPGKDFGFSATTNFAGSDLLFVFSTSTIFKAERSYTKFVAFALLNHAGEFKTAARALADRYEMPKAKRSALSNDDIGADHGVERHVDRNDDDAYEACEGVVRPTKYSDDALADLFSKKYKDDFRFVDEWGWLQWTNTRWQPVSDFVVMGYARQICRNQSQLCENDPDITPKSRSTLARAVASAKTVAAVIKLAAGDKYHYLESSGFNADVWLFNTPKGTIDLRTGTLRQHRPTDYITKIANASPEGSCPKWLAFLDQITASDILLQSYLQRLAGYAMAGDPSEECLDFFYGLGGNGKGTFLKVLQHIFGEYSTTAATETFLESRGERHPTDLAKLAGARLVVAQEIDKGRSWNEFLVKTMTGRDEMTARFMRRDFFNFIPQFTLIISGNNKPSLKNVDPAWRRRLHIVPFNVTIPADKQNPNLKTELEAEADGILKWCLDGCLAWQKQRLSPPDTVLAATADYFVAEDTFEQWLTECCLRGQEGYHEASSLLHESYRHWKVNRGEKASGTKAFSTELEKSFRSKHGRTGTIFYGIRLTDEERDVAQANLTARKRAKQEGDSGL